MFQCLGSVSLEVYVAFCQVMALCQMAFIQYTITAGANTAEQRASRLQPLMSGRCFKPVWAPLLQRPTLELNDMANLEKAKVIVEESMGKDVKKLLRRVSKLSPWSHKY